MKRHLHKAVSVALLAVVAQQCASMDASSEEVPATQEIGEEALVRVVNVETVTIEPTAFVDFIRITGEAAALHDVVVSAEESGVIDNIASAKGRRVSQGQPLFGIGADVLRAQVDEARAASQLADEQYARQQRLWEQEGIGSEINFLSARYSAEMARARLGVLEARLEKTTVRAPVGGVFDEQYVDPGEIVAPGTAVARIVSIDRIKVIGGVPERFAPFVRAGRDAVVDFEIMPGENFAGSIAYVGSSVNEQSRTFPIEIVIDNPGGVIKPQMVANVRLVREELTDVMVLPQDFVVRSEAGYHVYVVDNSGGNPVAEERAVELGSSYGGRVVITGGVTFGETIVGLGAQLVDDGSRLAIVGEGGMQ